MILKIELMTLTFSLLKYSFQFSVYECLTVDYSSTAVKYRVNVLYLQALVDLAVYI